MKKLDNMLEQFKKACKTGNGITIVISEKERKRISYKQLWNRGCYVSELLKKQGVSRQDEVILKCDDQELFLYTFWACAIGGYIAIPIDPGNGNIEGKILSHIIENTNSPTIITDNKNAEKADARMIHMEEYRQDILQCGDYMDMKYEICDDDILYVQYSSGTTGNPHGVMIKKSNVEANIYGLIKQYAFDEKDKYVSWSPLTHCFGLIIYHMLPIMTGAEQCLIPTKFYMSHPLIWGQMIHEFQATVIGTLPFALKLFYNVFVKSGKEFNWDFNCVKILLIGGEQVNYGLCKEFCDALGKYGMTIDKIHTTYGLSEATITVTACRYKEMAKTVQVINEKLDIGTKIECKEIQDAQNVDHAFLDMGIKLETMELSIRDENFKDLPEEHLGLVYVKGDCITCGYFKDEEATKKAFGKDGWLCTGDVGFIREEKLYIIGRDKQLVVANGKKISCLLIEGMIIKELDIKKYQQCAVCNGITHNNEMEKVITFILTDQDINDSNELYEFIEMANRIKTMIFEKTGLTISEIIPINEIPKTNSGKVFRRGLTQKYNQGQYTAIVEKLNRGINSQNISKKTNLEVHISRNNIQKKIVDCIEKEFHIKVSDMDMPFSDYGIVSINIPTFTAHIQKEFHIEINVADLFSHFTITKLMNYIYSRINLSESKQEDHSCGAAIFDDKIAIVGMSCRFPGGANSIDAFWDLLMSEKEGVSDVPKDRWELEKYYDEDKTVEGKMYCKKGGFLDTSIRKFDAAFFNISPKEAAALDPQQRMLLELTWEAFENGNMNIQEYSGTKTGVYVGICNDEYKLASLYSGNPSKIGPYSLTGTSISTACGRISYTYGFEGPCISVDTACSTALTALHLACTAILMGEADVQVIGTSNVIECPITHIAFSKLQAISAGGYSKAFDASANGYGRGEGGGVLILKRLSDAVKDKNEILGIIRGSGINQDGKSNGLTAPNGAAQARLIKDTLTSARVNPKDIDYVEMHGTGTKLGDPIEAGAVGAVYGRGRDESNLLKIGSVKSNIGHLEASAGLASVIKVLLSMKYNKIPANLHFDTPNPLINWEKGNLKVVNTCIPWEKPNGIRMAAINGFGFGGSNAHVIIEEYKTTKVAIEQEKKEGMDYILKISAKNRNSLKAMIQKYYELLQRCQEDEFEDIIYTTDICRADLDYRFTVCGESRAIIIDRMKQYLENGQSEGIFTNIKNKNMMQKDKKMVFMFTGQGSQYLNMGKFLYQTNDVFEQAFDECDELFEPYLKKSVIELIYGKNQDSQEIERTVYAQPLIFSIEYALYKMWEYYGIKPDMVMGHSIGEYAAAVAASILSLSDAVKLVSYRGKLMDSAPGTGKMAAIFANETKVNQLLEGLESRVCIAVINAKEACVVSGYGDAVDVVRKRSLEESIQTKELKVSHGFHSMLMEPVLNEFREVAKTVEYHHARVKFLSCMYAKELEQGQILDSNYWTSHVREKVDFYGAVTSIEDLDQSILVEVGSNKVLSSACKMIFGEQQMIASTLHIKRPDSLQMAEDIAYLYAAGINIDWKKIAFKGKAVWEKVQLPAYVYDACDCWNELIYDQELIEENREIAQDFQKVLGQRIDLPFVNDSVVFQKQYSKVEPYFMGEHIIYGTAISPAAAHMALMLTAISEMEHVKSCELNKIEFRIPLAVGDDEKRQVQICLEKKEEEQSGFSIASRDFDTRNDKWNLHARGKFQTLNQYQYEELNMDPNEFEQLSLDKQLAEDIYSFMDNAGFQLGEGFRRIKRIHMKEDECICVVEPLKHIPNAKDYVLYPGTIDSVFQTGITLVLDTLKKRTDGGDTETKTVIPYYMEKFVYNDRPSDKLWCATKSTLKNDITYTDTIVYNEKGEVIIKVENLMAKITDSNSLLRDMKNLNKLYYHTAWMETEEIKKIVKIPNDKQYVLFYDQKDMATVISDEMKNQGLSVTVVSLKEIKKENQADYTISPKNQKDWIRLCNTLFGKYNRKDFSIIYCVGNTDEKMVYSAVNGLFYLVQAMNTMGYLKDSRVKIITRNVQNVLQENEFNLSGSLVWGLSKVLSIEYADIFDGIIDVDEEAVFNNKDFINEILGSDVQEICLRGKKRFSSRLISHLEYLKMNPEKNKKIVCKKDASYIITGGTGALGLVYADQLMKEGAENIVLMCRHEPSVKVKEKIKKFMDNGVKIKLVYADVCDYDSVLKAMEEINRDMPEVKGIVHTAGVLNDGMLAEMDWDAFLKVLEPKVSGTLNLYHAVNKEKLDFFMMLSSITSVIGNAGQANYASANAFLNTFAVYMGSKGYPGYTFCWGPWSHGGMAAKNDAVSKSMERMGMKPFGYEQGQMLIKDFMEQPYENMLIADVDFEKLAGFLKNASGKIEFLSRLVSSDDKTDDSNTGKMEENIRESLKTVDEEKRINYLVEKLQSVCGKIMGFGHGQVLDVDKSFYEQGADSLIIFSMRSAINKLLEMDLSVAEFFNYPTIVKLSGYILEKI